MDKSDKALLCIIVVAAILSFIGILDITQWLLEMVLMTLLLISYAIFAKKLSLSVLSKVLLTVFTVLHIYAAHYNYWVPLGELVFFDVLFGTSRNHFDRIIHLSFGVLFCIPFKEMYVRLKVRYPLYHSFMLILALSAVYEILEWSVAVILGNGGINFVGMQGDVWDSHIDMFLAAIGGLFVICIVKIRDLVKSS